MARTRVSLNVFVCDELHHMENPRLQPDFSQFQTSHQQQLEQIPRVYWDCLQDKLIRGVYDAGEHFMMSPLGEDEGGRGVYKVVTATEEGVKHSKPNNIFLIDHAWTYQLEFAHQQLIQIPGLASRMAHLMGLVDAEGGDEDGEDNDEEDVESEEDEEKKEENGKLSEEEAQDNLEPVSGGSAQQQSEEVACHAAVDNTKTVEVGDILTELWRFNSSYSFSSANTLEERVPVWFVLDEFGSSIQHSCQPSFAMVPFYYVPKQEAYSVIWPLRDIEYGDEVTVDYAANLKEGLMKSIHLLPWKPDSLPLDSPLWEEMSDFSLPEIKVRLSEQWPDPASTPSGPAAVGAKRPIKVFSELQIVRKHLTHSAFQIVDSEADADILWMCRHVTDFDALPLGELFVNQFPCEALITCKDLLAQVALRVGGAGADERAGPEWLPLTYNLVYELPQMVREYYQRQESGVPNVWIVKPWNLGRGMDSLVTDDINAIIRLSAASPRVACRYITDPVLFYRDDVGGYVKMDIRYVLLLKCVQPLGLYANRVFWLRFANKPFSLADLNDYQTHCTVMNYREDAVLKNILYDEFVPLFEQQYPDHPWREVEESIFSCLRQFFQAAVSAPPPAGIAHSPQSRALYAVDLMLEWRNGKDGCRRMVPQLLEVNYSPDNERACKYYPEFYNDAFSVLFLDDDKNNSVVKLV